MTKRFSLIFLAVLALALVLPLAAQTAAPLPVPVTVDPSTVAGILAIFGIGVLGIIQTLKTLLKWDGTLALLLAGGVSLAATAAYLVMHNAFNVIAWVIYSAIVFGEASGLYKLIVPKPTA